jgi:catechol 2,3-dioxygenase-like lactoylglutathione lyase family enzyme
VTNPTPPFVECEKTQTSLPVRDLAAAIEFYVTKLGFRFGFTFEEPATFVGCESGECEDFFEGGTPAPNAGALFFSVGGCGCVV